MWKKMTFGKLKASDIVTSDTSLIWLSTTEGCTLEKRILQCLQHEWELNNLPKEYECKVKYYTDHLLMCKNGEDSLPLDTMN